MLSEGFWDGVIRQREEGRNEYEFYLCATRDMWMHCYIREYGL
jgi:hypothetical protein